MVGEGNRNRPVPVPGSRRNPGCLAQISKTGLGLPAFGLGLVWETNADHCGVPSDLSDSKNELGEKENAPFDASPPNHCPPLTTRRLASEAQLAFSPVAHGKPAGTCSMTPSPQLPSPALARRLARGASPGACRVSDHTSPLPAQGLDTCAAASALSSRLVPPVHSDEDGDGLVARGTSDVEDTDDEDVIMGMMTQTSENAANQKLPCLDAGSRDERPLHFNEKHEKQCLDMRDSLPGFPVHFHLKGQCSPVASMSSIPLAAVTAAQKGGISAQDCTLRLPAYVDEVGGLNSTLKPGGRVVYAAVPPQPCQAQTADPCCKISQRFCMTAETEEKDKEGLMGNQQKRTARHLQSRANVKRQKVGEPAENRQTKAIPFKELTNLDLSLISKRDGRESMTRSKFSKGELSQKGALLESCTASSENGECPGNLSCEVYEGRNDATIYMVKPIVNERSDCARLAQMRVKFSRVQDGGMRTAQDQAAAQRVATGSPGRQRCERAEGPSIPPHACDSGLAAPGMQGAGRLARGQTNAWSFIHPSRMLVGCGARSPCHQVAGRDTTRCLDSCGDPKESATMASPLCRPNGVEAKEGRGKAGQQEQEQEPAAEQGSKPPRDTSSESLGIVAEFWRSAEEESHETGSALQANEDDDIVQDSEGEEEQSVRWLPLQEGLWKGGRGTELRSRERDSRAEAAVRLHGTGTGTTDPAAREDDVANLAWGQKLQKWENNLLGVSAEKEEGREMRCDSRAKQSVECSGDPSVPKGCQREGELEHGRRVATGAVDGPVACPICGVDLRHLAPSWRDRHSNQCLDSQDRGALGGPPLLLPILLQQGKEKEKEKEKGKEEEEEEEEAEPVHAVPEAGTTSTNREENGGANGEANGEAHLEVNGASNGAVAVEESPAPTPAAAAAAASAAAVAVAVAAPDPPPHSEGLLEMTGPKKGSEVKLITPEDEGETFPATGDDGLTPLQRARLAYRAGTASGNLIQGSRSMTSDGSGEAGGKVEFALPPPSITRAAKMSGKLAAKANLPTSMGGRGKMDRKAKEEAEVAVGRAIRESLGQSNVPLMKPRAVTDFKVYTLKELQVAMDNFWPNHILGEGSYGIVYRGLLEGVDVAIKQLKNPDHNAAMEEIDRELEVQKRCNHQNLVRLLGYSVEDRSLVYEYLCNGSLEDRLLCMGGSPPLLWPDRCRIAMEVAAALHHLHTRPPPIVHRDVKPANVLLDEHFVAKLGDVGLARLMEDMANGNTHIVRKSVIVGTEHYVDPEYLCARRGYLGPKSDVYSFGIVLLQLLVGGIPNLRKIDMAVEQENLKALLDPRAGDWPVALAMDMANLGLWCSEMDRKDRPDLEEEVIPALLEICEAAAQEVVEQEVRKENARTEAKAKEEALALAREEAAQLKAAEEAKRVADEEAARAAEAARREEQALREAAERAAAAQRAAAAAAAAAAKSASQVAKGPDAPPLQKAPRVSETEPTPPAAAAPVPAPKPEVQAEVRKPAPAPVAARRPPPSDAAKADGGCGCVIL